MSDPPSLKLILRKYRKEGDLNAPEIEKLLSDCNEFSFEGVNYNFFGRHDTEEYENLLIKLHEFYPDATKRTIIKGINAYLGYRYIAWLMFLKARLWTLFSPEEIKILLEEKKLPIQEKFEDLLTSLDPEYHADVFWRDEKEDLYPGDYDDDRIDEYQRKFTSLRKMLRESLEEFLHYT